MQDVNVIGKLVYDTLADLVDELNIQFSDVHAATSSFLNDKIFCVRAQHFVKLRPFQPVEHVVPYFFTLQHLCGEVVAERAADFLLPL